MNYYISQNQRNWHNNQFNNYNSQKNAFNWDAYSGEDFSPQTALSLEYFENHWAKSFFESLNSTSSVRKIYDNYLTCYEKYKDSPESLKLQIEIWFAKVAYQESRKIFPQGFMRFLKKIYDKVNKDSQYFKDFLEVFVAYHKFFNPKAKQ